MSMLHEERPRVLIVDDQKNWRETLCDMLEPACEIETATSYKEAKRQLWQRAFHVLVTDQRLVDPDTTNIEGILLIDEVAKLRDGTQTIIVTGYPTIAAAKAALRGRDAYDYLLKRPEEGGPFKIREFRTLVKEASEKAIQVRQKAITLDFSLSNLTDGLTYEQIAETLSPGYLLTHVELDDARRVSNRLLFPFQPFAPGMARAHWLESDQICEILCWSREYGKATSVQIGRDLQQIKTHKVEWLKNSWRLVIDSEIASASLSGVAYVIDGMTFEDFASQLEDKQHGV